MDSYQRVNKVRSDEKSDANPNVIKLTSSGKRQGYFRYAVKLFTRVRLKSLSLSFLLNFLFMVLSYSHICMCINTVCLYAQVFS